MSSDEQVERAILLERERCATMVLLHTEHVKDPMMKHLLIRISNLINSGRPATKEAVDFLAQLLNDND